LTGQVNVTPAALTFGNQEFRPPDLRINSKTYLQTQLLKMTLQIV